MSSVGVVLLALGFAVPAYAFAVYPGVLWLLARFRRGAEPVEGPNEWPFVTITVPVYNEERAIAANLEALLSIDYPPDRRQLLVISDASNDHTDSIVRGYADRGVELLRLPERGGKTAAENAGREHARGEIVINTDATIRIDPGGIKALVARFADPTVGVASGRDVSLARNEDDANVAEAGYVGYEMWVRDLETRLGGIVGASGCCFAARRDLHMEFVPEALSRDFAAPLIARENGFRSVSVNEAVCYVPRTDSPHREYRRKVRTMTRGLETLNYKRHLLNPLRYGAFAWKLLSHKLARWCVPWAALFGTLGLLLLTVQYPWARVLAAAGLVVIVIAAFGWFGQSHRRLPWVVASPTYVVAGLVAGLEAWMRASSGELNSIWEPTRRDGGS